MSYFEEEEFKDVRFDVSVWRRIVTYMKPIKKDVFIAIVAVIIIALADVTYPLLNRYGIDTIIASGDLSLLPWFVAGYAVYMTVIGLTVYIFITFAGKVESYLAYFIREKAYRNLQHLSYSYFDRTPVGWIMARMTSDARNLSDILSWGLIDMAWGFLMMIGITIAMFVINIQLALIALTALPVLVFLSLYFRIRILKAFRLIRKQNSKITGAYNEGIGGAKTTKTLVLEEKNYHDFEGLTRSMRDHSVKAAVFAGLYFPSIIFVSSITTALIFYYGGLNVASQVITLGVLYVFVSYVGQFFEPIMQLANILARFQQAQASGERILSLIDTTPDITDSAEVIAQYGTLEEPLKENWETLQGHIVFDNVTFKYHKGETVLKTFNLEVQAGESIALVGHTGAGKSTIVNLICRFYEPSDGRILIDGKDYKDRSVSWLHDQLGYVLQSPQLFSGTIRENIRYGRLDATDNEVEEAARLVEADRFIDTFERGYETQVGESGARLSVGQKQLISFARALIANPRILILDEATSSVDTETEKSIQKAIRIIMEGRTTFIIAHRLSTITQADRILVLEDGEVIEEGTHATLMKQGQHYHKLFMNQFKRRQIDVSMNTPT